MSSLGNCVVFSKNLKRLMDLNGVDRNDVCAALDFKYTTFTDWYNGKKYPRIDKIEKLANYFGVLKSELIEEKNSPSADELSPKKQALMQFVQAVPEDKAEMILQVMKTILQVD